MLNKSRPFLSPLTLILTPQAIIMIFLTHVDNSVIKKQRKTKNRRQENVIKKERKTKNRRQEKDAKTDMVVPPTEQEGNVCKESKYEFPEKLRSNDLALSSEISLKS